MGRVRCQVAGWRSSQGWFESIGPCELAAQRRRVVFRLGDGGCSEGDVGWCAIGGGVCRSVTLGGGPGVRGGWCAPFQVPRRRTDE